MFRMLILTTASLSFLYGQMCPPGTVRSNPNPVRIASAPEQIVKVLDTFYLNQEAEKKVRLTRGASVWFAANGCPKMGQIGLSVLDNRGKVLKQALDYRPDLCFTAPADGEYTVKVKAVSLARGTSGTIDARLSHSQCGGGTQ